MSSSIKVSKNARLKRYQKQVQNTSSLLPHCCKGTDAAAADEVTDLVVISMLFCVSIMKPRLAVAYAWRYIICSVSENFKIDSGANLFGYWLRIIL